MKNDLEKLDHVIIFFAYILIFVLFNATLLLQQKYDLNFFWTIISYIPVSYLIYRAVTKAHLYEKNKLY